MKSTIGEVEKSIFLNANNWMQYIDSLPEPNDAFERSINQYRCETYMRKLLHEYCLAREVIAIPLIIFSLITSYIRIFSIVAISNLQRQNNYTDILVLVNNNKQAKLTKEKLPAKLLKKYKKITFITVKRKSKLISKNKNSSLSYIIKKLLKDYWSSPYFQFVTITHLFAINNWIEKYNPKCIVVSEGENDYTSSLITYYCEQRNVKYINIMHGENFLNPYHAFVKFSEFYVWNDYYILQYLRTKSPREMFRVYDNCFNLKRSKEHIQKYYITYYLQDQNVQELSYIKQILEKFIVNGYTCKVRPHPTATNIDLLKKIIYNSKIVYEDPRTVKIEDSISCSEYIVSMYSTVITEAYYMGKKILIDDVTNPELYSGLKICMYINIDRISGRLSKAIEKEI